MSDIEDSLPEEDIALMRHHDLQAAVSTAHGRSPFSSAFESLLTLDGTSLAAFSKHFDLLTKQIQDLLDYLSEQSQIVAREQYDRSGNPISIADSEIARFNHILRQIDELENDFNRIRQIREIVRTYRQRVEDMERHDERSQFNAPRFYSGAMQGSLRLSTSKNRGDSKTISITAARVPKSGPPIVTPKKSPEPKLLLTERPSASSVLKSKLSLNNRKRNDILGSNGKSSNCNIVEYKPNTISCADRKDIQDTIKDSFTYNCSNSDLIYSSDADAECFMKMGDLSIQDEAAITSIWDPLHQGLIERVMEVFWVIFNQKWSFKGYQYGSGGSSGSSHNTESASRSQHKSSMEASSMYRRKRQKGSAEYSDDNQDDNRRRPRKLPARYSDCYSNDRFACPFRKCNPSKYSIYAHRVCALSNWGTIARVKEHLYRCHQAGFYCKRCWQTFQSQSLLDLHMMVDAVNICQIKEGQPPDGLTPETERALRRRAKSSPDQTEAERWKNIYKLLFPTHDVPSPSKALFYLDCTIKP